MPKPSGMDKKSPEELPKRRPPARTRERRLEQLAGMAEELVEERMRNGTASPTEVTAVLRYSSPTEIANLKRIEAQTRYLEAQRAKAESETVNADMADRAVAAMHKYRGLEPQ